MKKLLSSLFMCIAVVMSMMLLCGTDVSAKSKRKPHQSYAVVWRKTEKWSVSKTDNAVKDDIIYIGKNEINSYERGRKADIDSQSLKSIIKWTSDTWRAKKTSKATIYKCKVSFTSNENSNWTSATVAKTVMLRKAKRYSKTEYVWKQTSDSMKMISADPNNDEISGQLYNIAREEISSYVDGDVSDTTGAADLIADYNVDLEERHYNKRNSRKTIYTCYIDYQTTDGTVGSAVFERTITSKKVSKTTYRYVYC